MKINKTNIAKILRESVFAPKLNKTMGVIVEVGNFDYYIRRARELEGEALFCGSKKKRQELLKMAISLLALARLVDSDPVSTSDLTVTSVEPKVTVEYVDPPATKKMRLPKEEIKRYRHAAEEYGGCG